MDIQSIKEKYCIDEGKRTFILKYEQIVTPSGGHDTIKKEIQASGSEDAVKKACALLKNPSIKLHNGSLDIIDKKTGLPAAGAFLSPRPRGKEYLAKEASNPSAWDIKHTVW